MKTEAINCPNCGAPLAFDAEKISSQHKLVLCIYCNSSIRLTPAEPGAPSTKMESTKVETAPEVGEEVKQLIVDGKRSEAIAYYAEHAGISTAEAEAAVDRLSIPLAFRLIHQSPLDLWAILLSLAIIGGLAWLTGWTLLQALQGTWFYLLASVLCGYLLVGRIRWLVPKAVSTWVHTFGTRGRGKILKVAAISPTVRKGGTLVVVLLEVQPDGGGEPFRDEESWLIRNESLYKIQPGHVIPVRYDAGKGDRVFPISPIKVWDAQRGEFA
jgi:hypothetical protein